MLLHKDCICSFKLTFNEVETGNKVHFDKRIMCFFPGQELVIERRM